MVTAANPAYVYAARDGWRGQVIINDRPCERKVVRCCPGEGWAEVAVEKDGRVQINESGDAIAVERIYGAVQFLPFKESPR